MATKSLQRKIEDAKVEGWQVYEEHGDERVTMIKRKKGTLGGHVLIFFLTAWWTLGLGNVCYAAYKYFGDSDKKVIRDDEDEQEVTA